MDLVNKYERKTALEHVLHAPDMYIGSMKSSEMEMWVMKTNIEKITMEYIAGLYKLFDEIVVNAHDQFVRSPEHPVTDIKCIIEDGSITIVNNGDGIEVAMHPTYGVYVPQLIFTEMLTSSNYNKEDKKIVGGKNGLGVKLAMIWSSHAVVETVDSTRQLKYRQEYHNNLSILDPPTIVPCKGKPFTSIQFTPDYARMGIPGLSPDHISLFHRRMVDIAALTSKQVKVWFNHALIPVNSLLQYAQMFGHKNLVQESMPRWEFVVGMSQEPCHVTFVNGIYTQNGGRHLEHFMNILLRKLTVLIQSKKKIDVLKRTLRDRMFVVLKCTIENPSFDSQTKDCLTTPTSEFGSTCDISDKFVNKVASLGFMDLAVDTVKFKEFKECKKQDGAKSRQIHGIPKYSGANRAGTAESYKCTLILCEGDSAKSSVISALSKADHDFFGVYPMKGKIMNVRGIELTKINANKEIHELKQIIGLELGKVYTAEDIRTRLRYGKILLMTDQDKDGSHIKGLCINLFGSMWNSLLHHPFISYMNTPIVKATKGKHELLFNTEQELETWKLSQPTGWTIKYCKGLGTHTAAEFTKLFLNREKHVVNFQWKEEDEDAIDKLFNKKRADDRKQWLQSFKRAKSMDSAQSTISYSNFIDNELIHFSIYDCQRSIASVLDGLKPSQRKILFGTLKKNVTSDIKVAQLSGYISEHTAYHHGENSLNGAIVNMAQTFVGSNNIHLLVPSGQFGTRIEGGHDSASERYIFTRLCEYTRTIFPKDDDAVLRYTMDDGEPMEPVYYLPIIPMVLVNGCCGIGTGTSSNVPCFNPVDIIDHLLQKLNGNHLVFDPTPFYRGFQGTIVRDKNHYLVTGKWHQPTPTTLCITELPVGIWTSAYKKFLEDLPCVKDIHDNCTDVFIDFTIRLTEPVNDVVSTFKLSKTISTSNMNLFDPNEELHKYECVNDIMETFYSERLKLYAIRKDNVLTLWNKDLHKLEHKIKFIQAVLNNTLELRQRTMAAIVDDLIRLNIDMVDGSYHYVTKLPMDSVTLENVHILQVSHDKLRHQVKTLHDSSVEKLWMDELEDLKMKI
jgi:DNA topoisomerase-2